MNRNPETPPLLRCEGLDKRLGSVQVLSGVGFSAFPGEILGIIGPNGAGKTTLMECLAGLLPLDSGTLRWGDRPLDERLARRVLFYLPDGILPYADDRVAQVLDFFRRIHAADRQALRDLVRRLGLETALEKRVRALSKGYRRRLLLAIGLLSSQPLLLLDEPFDGFDLRQTLGIMALLRESLSKRALLLSIHQLSEAERICHRFLLLDEGAVAGLGTLEELRRQAGVSERAGLEEVFLALV